MTTFYRAEQSVLRPGGPRTTTGSRTRATLARREVPEDLGQNLFPGTQRPEPSREGGAPLGSEARGRGLWEGPGVLRSLRRGRASAVGRMGPGLGRGIRCVWAASRVQVSSCQGWRKRLGPG